MKIEIEIPDKYADTNLTLMWGMVPIARYRYTKRQWEIKTGNCSRCGLCCEKVKDKNRHPFAGEKGCRYLGSPGNGNICQLGIYRPVGCSIADSNLDSCSIKWEVIKWRRITHK